jgi:SAM-dependent methyltransferase
MMSERASGDPSFHDWYEANAHQFLESVAVELQFARLDPEGQQRLDRFKLGPLRDPALVDFRDKDVLEFGAGHGRLALRIQGYRTYLGVDFAETLVRMGERRLREAGVGDRARLVVGDCLSFAGPAGAYDIVCSLGMVPYIDDLDAVVRRMAYHAKPGGIVVFDFRHATPLYTMMRRLARPLRTETGGSSHAQSKRRLADALRRVDVTDIRFVMREYPWLADWYAARRWEWALGVKDMLAKHRWLDWLGLVGFVIARKSGTSGVPGGSS